jgi:hypothetical protein
MLGLVSVAHEQWITDDDIIIPLHDFQQPSRWYYQAREGFYV